MTGTLNRYCLQSNSPALTDGNIYGVSATDYADIPSANAAALALITATISANDGSTSQNIGVTIYDRESPTQSVIGMDFLINYSPDGL